MPRHPDIVPAEHQHSEAENAGVEQFLAAAAEQLRQPAGEQSDYAGAEHAGHDATCDPAPAPGDAGRHRHHDADNQAGFEDLTKYNHQRSKHGHLGTGILARDIRGIGEPRQLCQSESGSRQKIGIVIIMQT
jgi:hypothetical protein